MLGVVRHVVLLVLAAAACSDASQTNDLPPVRAPERADRGDAGGGPTDAGPITPEPSDGSFVEASTCKDGVQDGDESDVDCGGTTCLPCANGKKCSTRKDCASAVCATGTCSGDLGCSDGTREAFASIGAFPNIAACSGGWSVPGVIGTTAPACNRLSGNDSANATGAGCNVADLCQIGWHVCNGPADVAGKSDGTGCANAAFPADTFFATRASGNGIALCEATGANDLFGCGSIGSTPDPGTCGVLDRSSADLCAAIPATFACGADGTQEANAVTKSDSANGGVLCCRD